MNGTLTAFKMKICLHSFVYFLDGGVNKSNEKLKGF